MIKQTEIGEETKTIHYMCFNKTQKCYVYFWDGYDNIYEFDSAEELEKHIEGNYGPLWRHYIELHIFEVSRKRIS